MVSLMVILFSTKCFLFVYKYIDLLKLKAYKLNFFFKEANLYHLCLICRLQWISIKPLPHMPILGSSNSAANKDMVARIWTNVDTVICLSRKHCGKKEKLLATSNSPIATMFSKAVSCWCVKTSIYGVTG